MHIIRCQETATAYHCIWSLISKQRGNGKLWQYQPSTFPLFWLHNYTMVGILVKRGDAFISTRSKAYVISTDYMQICHRHKSTAVHSLTFLFVTSKHSLLPLLGLLFGPVDKCILFRRGTKHLSPLFTPVSYITAHQTSQYVNMFGCVSIQFGFYHPCWWEISLALFLFMQFYAYHSYRLFRTIF